jgi:hypothetical protein
MQKIMSQILSVFFGVVLVISIGLFCNLDHIFAGNDVAILIFIPVTVFFMMMSGTLIEISAGHYYNAVA